MIQKPTRRELLIGGMATTIMGTLANSVVADGFRASKPNLQSNGDPIISVPPSVSASGSMCFYITVYRPTNYTPGVQFKVKVVRMNFGVNSQNDMTSGYTDSGLDGIVDGEFSTTITFPANSAPIVVEVPVESMTSQTTKNFTVVAYNGANSASGTFQLTP